MSVRFEVDFSHVIHELDRLGDGPGHDGTTFRLEGVMLTNFQATQEQVHVITGHLKSSGHPSSSFDGEKWEGTISYPRKPGIFELARGNAPSQLHPEGGHYFFESSYQETPAEYKEAVLGFLRGENGS